MIIYANTLTPAQESAIEQLRADEAGWYDLTLDMPRINGADAWVTGTPTWGGEDRCPVWTVDANGKVEVMA